MKKSRLLLTILCAGLLTLAACSSGGGRVTPPDPGPVDPVNDPSLNFTEKAIKVDEEFTLTVSDVPEDTTPIWSQTGSAVSFILESIVKADSAKVKGLEAGEATISVIVGETTLSCKVTVSAVEPVGPTSIALNKSSLALSVGDTETLTTDYEGEESLTWTSADAAVATVANGVVTAVAAGSTTITVKFTNYPNVQASCTVAVSAAQPSGPTSIALNKTSTTLTVGNTETLTTDYEGEEQLSWTSSDAEVATVAEGVVTAVAEGTATVTVKFKNYPSVKATCAVKVIKAVDPADMLITEPTEILVKTTFNDTYGQILQDAANDLMAKETNVTVKYEKYGGSYSQLKDDVINGIPAGNYPDVTVVYPDSVAEFIEAQVQLNMNKYINNAEYGWTDEEKEDFFEVYLDEGRKYSISGTYSLPLAKSTEAMYYDADKILGLTLKGVNGGNAITEEYINNLTWEELFDVFCPALMEYRSGLSESEQKSFLNMTDYTDAAIVGYDSDDNLFITLAEQYGYGYTSINKTTGTGVIDFNNPEMKELMKTFNEAYKNKYFTTKGIIGTNVNNRSTVDAMLFSIGSTGGVNYQFSDKNPKHVKVAPIPHAEGRELKTIQQGPSITILNHKDDNRALASWLFYKELTTAQRNIAWSTTTGYSPIRESVVESDDFLDYCDESQFDEKTIDHLKALNAQYAADYTFSLFSSPVFKGSAEARVQVGGLATKAIGAEDLTDTLLNQLFQEAYDNTILKM